MNFSFCLQAWIWLCRGAVGSTGRTRVCKPSQDTPPSLPAGEPRWDGQGLGWAQHPRTLLISRRLCAPCVLSPGQGSALGEFMCRDLSSGASQPIVAPSTAPLNHLLQCLGRQELSWLCHSRVCKNASRKSLQTWLRIPTKQTFLFPLLSFFPWPVQMGRGRRLSCPKPISDGDFSGERTSSLPNHFASTVRTDGFLLQGLARGEAA